MKQKTEQLDELIEVAYRLRPLVEDIDSIGQTIVEALKNGSKLLTCGNGGSAADALHLAEELLGRYNRERRPLPAICICADASTITCVSNDFGYDHVFGRQVEALGTDGDILIGFSTSGNSKNVIDAFETARQKGIRSVLLGGKDGGLLKALADNSIIVPSMNTARIQEMHTFILHSWLELIDDEFC